MHGRLRSVARRLIQAGKLPKDAVLLVHARPSAGANCRLCDFAITAQAAEIEMKTDEPTGVQLHPDCYAVWLAEVRSKS
jgi:hypothetical protein